MRLLVTTPMSVVVDAEDVRYVRADDESGAFGVLPGHADFLTVLTVSVITWRNHTDDEHHVAVAGGVMRVHGGSLVEVVTREAVGEDSLRQLGGAVLERLRVQQSEEQESRISATRLHLAAIRQIQRYLESGRRSFLRGQVSMPLTPLSANGPPGEDGTP